MKKPRNFISKMMCVAVAAITMISLCSCGGGSNSPYAPWTDLSHHFDLSKVQSSGDNIYHFNSYELCQGKIPYRNERLNDNEYIATVLGRNVLLRSDRRIAKSTMIGSVNTGDVVAVQSCSEFVNGKYWNYVQVRSGKSAGRWGYICTDYLIEQEQYRAFKDYVLEAYSNLSIYDESKYLNAISSVLLKLNVNHYHPQLAVNVNDVKVWGRYAVVAFQIKNPNISENNSLLAFVQFTEGENDYVVLGIVPGFAARDMMMMPNGSFDIYYVK